MDAGENRQNRVLGPLLLGRDYLQKSRSGTTNRKRRLQGLEGILMTCESTVVCITLRPGKYRNAHKKTTGAENGKNRLQNIGVKKPPFALPFAKQYENA